MRTLFALLLFLALDGLLLAQAEINKSSRPLVFNHVKVVDVANGKLKPDMTVVVVGNRIVSVGKSEKVRIPKDAQVVEARGKFLIPGLWDMHAHGLTDRSTYLHFPLFISHGVTGIRDLGTSLSFDQINQLRKEIAEARIIGPRIFAGGPIVNGPDPLMLKDSPPTMWVTVTTEEEARRAVNFLKGQGADFIKVTIILIV
jgi:hypothetical protein